LRPGEGRDAAALLAASSTFWTLRNPSKSI
jgi:hypothetical protein